MAEAHADPNKDAPYYLVYWHVIPGRGEHIRLCFAEAGVPYSDTAFTEGGMDTLHGHISENNTGDEENPPPFAPPILKYGDLVISQTPNILINEVHNCHHPIAIDLHYEDQKEECLRRVKDWVKHRLPKYLGYFERVLAGKASGEGPLLYGGVLTWADLVFFQTLDGTTYFFRKAVAAARKSGKYERVFQHYEAVKARPRIAEYLASDRRQKYSNYGVYRYYEKLDVEPEE
ncbi:glutathione S-transferase domain-containing protein [Hypoxylon rubiginosum]|uniref:Glutathione S-transferase domain-containing protein n=1 Tax=Hypoxylon rubiginosum TaxID=110542 RepID=A0ACB9Z1W4_9PEZI|nr:glutathione S-transferase domain-containing protein [Hypoxylon rubiginosum]